MADLSQSRGLAAQRRKDEDNVRVVYKESESSGQLNTATLAVVLALVAWYIAVEKPKTDALGQLHTDYLGIKTRLVDLEGKVRRFDGESTKAAVEGLGNDLTDVRKDLSGRLTSLKHLVDELQTKQAVDRKLVEEHRQQDVKTVGELKSTFGKLVREITELKGDLDSASRLEKAFAAMEGRPVAPPPPPPPAQRETKAKEGRKEQSPGDPKIQEATGGLVELSEKDFQKLLDEGDTWVVMFYAPWCGHCTAAKPEFQQAALQAPVHFAQIDADKYADIALSESIPGYPTIRLYSKGKQVRAFEGERTAVHFLEFAKSFDK